MYGSQTPMQGDGKALCTVMMTNLISCSGSRGYHGYSTPSHDPSRTPLHSGSAWDPSITNTPAR